MHLLQFSIFSATDGSLIKFSRFSPSICRSFAFDNLLSQVLSISFGSIFKEPAGPEETIWGLQNCWPLHDVSEGVEDAPMDPVSNGLIQ